MPHICKRQEANKSSVRALRDIRKFWKKSKTPQLNWLFPFSKFMNGYKHKLKRFKVNAAHLLRAKNSVKHRGYHQTRWKPFCIKVSKKREPSWFFWKLLLFFETSGAADFSDSKKVVNHGGDITKRFQKFFVSKKEVVSDYFWYFWKFLASKNYA